MQAIEQGGVSVLQGQAPSRHVLHNYVRHAQIACQTALGRAEEGAPGARDHDSCSRGGGGNFFRIRGSILRLRELSLLSFLSPVVVEIFSDSGGVYLGWVLTGGGGGGGGGDIYRSAPICNQGGHL